MDNVLHPKSAIARTRAKRACPPCTKKERKKELREAEKYLQERAEKLLEMARQLGIVRDLLSDEEDDGCGPICNGGAILGDEDSWRDCGYDIVRGVQPINAWLRKMQKKVGDEELWEGFCVQTGVNKTPGFDP